MQKAIRRARRKSRPRCLSASRVQLAALAAHHAVPAIYPFARITEAGGLMSYGPSTQTGPPSRHLYRSHPPRARNQLTCRCVQPTKFELVINLKTAKTLGIEVPPTLLARADEVIE